MKAHVRRLLSSGQPTYEYTEPSKEVPTSNPKSTISVDLDDREARKPSITEVSASSAQGTVGATHYATRSNGSCSDASVSSELEALLPPVDNFKEEDRAQWEPLSTDKFARQKNTPR